MKTNWTHHCSNTDDNYGVQATKIGDRCQFCNMSREEVVIDLSEEDREFYDWLDTDCCPRCGINEIDESKEIWCDHCTVERN